jgi:hypothetical protein
LEAVYPERAISLVQQMDRWLDAIAVDTAPGTRAAKLSRNKPATLGDSCWATDGEHIVEQSIYRGPGRCDQMYPAYGDPRIAAGGPLADDVLKCALKPIDPADYAYPLTADQLGRLRAIFPSGVCDYRRPGIGQGITRKTWLRL